MGKMSVTGLMMHLNQSLFLDCFKSPKVEYKDLHPLSNQIFAFFIENSFPVPYNDPELTGGIEIGDKSKAHKSSTGKYSAFGKYIIDDISIAVDNSEGMADF